MIESDVIRQVEDTFPFLAKEYGYRVIACRLFANDANWIVVLESKTCGRFLAMQDRGEIIIALGPDVIADSATAGRWFDLAVLVEYLSQGEHMLKAHLDDPTLQLDRMADVLQPYMGQICYLFGRTDFISAEEDLNRIAKRREMELNGDSSRDGHG